MKKHTHAAVAGLHEARAELDSIDREIIVLLSRRANVARTLGRAKQSVGEPIRDVARERELLSMRKTWAMELGLAESQIENIFKAVLRFSRDVQAQVRRAVRAPK